jgi:hypothetical protein
VTKQRLLKFSRATGLSRMDVHVPFPCRKENWEEVGDPYGKHNIDQTASPEKFESNETVKKGRARTVFVLLRQIG